MLIYTISDADAHLTDVPPPAQRSFLAKNSQSLEFTTSIESSDSSKDVIEKYNENLSTGNSPIWLKEDFEQATLSDIEVHSR